MGVLAAWSMEPVSLWLLWMFSRSMVVSRPISLMSEGAFSKNLVSVGLTHLHLRGATPETVKKAFEILLKDPKVKSIFINIFGGMLTNVALDLLLNFFAGIMRCDYIAEGVIKATTELKLEIPLVVRLKGTMEQEAKRYNTLVIAQNISQHHFRFTE
jgi:hypothetical protein